MQVLISHMGSTRSSSRFLTMQSFLLRLLMAMASLQHINERLMLGEFTSPRRPIPVPHEAIWTDVKWASEEVWSGLAEGRR